MASQEATASEELTNFVTCPVCNEILSNPKLLPCLHSICLACLQNIGVTDFKGDTTQQCPVCRYHGLVPTLDVLDDNSFLERLKTTHLNTNELTVVCELCKNDGFNEVATFTCIQCNDGLCDACARFHCRTKFTRHHVVISLADVREGKFVEEIRGNMKMYCKIHVDEELKLFCQNCQQPVCMLCKSFDHENHVMVNFQVAVAEADDTLSSLSGILKSRLSEIDERKSLINDVKTKAETKLNNLRTELDQWASALKQKIDLTKAKLLEEIIGHERDVESIHAMETCGLNAREVSLQHGLKYILKVMQLATTAEKVKHKGTVLEYLKTLENDLILKSYNSPLFHLLTTDLPEPPASLQIKERNISTIGVPTIRPKTELVNSFSIGEGCDVYGIAVDSDGAILIPVRNKGKLAKFDSSGKKMATFGNKGKYKLKSPCDVAISNQGVIFVTDDDGQSLIRISQQDMFGQIEKTGEVLVKNIYNGWGSIAINSDGEIYVTSYEITRILNSDGQVIGEITTENVETNKAQFMNIAVSPLDGSIAISDHKLKCVHILDKTHKLMYRYRPEGKLALLSPHGVCFDEYGYVIVADCSSKENVHLITCTGEHVRILVDRIKAPNGVSILRPGEFVVTSQSGSVSVFKYLDV